MEKYLTRGIILIITSIVVLYFGILNSVGLFTICYDDYGCADLLSYIALLLYPVAVAWPLSLLTYKMRDEVFRVWSRFALWFVPLSMIAILLAPEDDGGAWSIPIKGPVALLTTGVFLLISLGLIAWKHFSLKKG